MYLFIIICKKKKLQIALIPKNANRWRKLNINNIKLILKIENTTVNLHYISALYLAF